MEAVHLTVGKNVETKLEDMVVDNNVHSLKIKPEYVLSERAKSLGPIETVHVETEEDHVIDDRDRNDGGQRGRKKRRRGGRGQTKKRPRDARQDASQKICMAVLRNAPCPYGDSCRFSHDLNEYMKTRPADIEALKETTGGTCPNHQNNSYCIYGAMCRIGSGHITKLGVNVCNESITSLEGNNNSDQVLDFTTGNILPRDVQTQLRKNKYPFQCKRHSEVNNKSKKEASSSSVDVKEEDSVVSGRKTCASMTVKKDNAVDSNKNVPDIEKTEKEDNVDNDVDIESSKNCVEKLKQNDDAVSREKNPAEASSNEGNNNASVEDPQESDKKTDARNPPTIQTVISSANSFTPLDNLRIKKIVDFSNKVYIAPLTTVGNLPFRRIMKQFGADITCGEMAMSTNLLSGQSSEWALLKRHESEDIFGVQLAAAHPDQYTRVSQLVEKYTTVDFVDLNLGCPLDLLCDKGAGAALMMRERKLKGALVGMSKTLGCSITVKMRTGWNMHKPFAHELVPKIQTWKIDGLAAIMVHGRSRLQRYKLDANWDYISQVENSESNDFPKIPIIGNGDIFSYSEYKEKVLAHENLSPTAMLGRGALIKPWLPTEIKEKKDWDISASERLDILKDFVRNGLEHWGSDQQGVNNTRRFLLEWLSFLYRYVPVGLLEVLPQKMNQRPPLYLQGRNDLETLFLSPHAADWIKISEILMGPVAENFSFRPKHKSASYESNG